VQAGNEEGGAVVTRRELPHAEARRTWRWTLGARHRHRTSVGFVASLGLLAVLGACSSGASTSTTSSSATSSANSGTTPSSSASPGVTSTTITVGQVDDLTSPVAGLFKGAEDGTRAYFDYVNSQGGVDGRKIVLDAQDSAYQGGVVASATTNMIQNDFALVGGFSLLDAAQLPLINAAHMPDVAYPLSVPLANSPYVYSAAPNTTEDFPIGFMEYLKQTYPNAIKRVGILWANATPATQAAETAFEHAMNSLGFKIVYDRGFSPGETTYLSDVLAMKAKGVQLFYSQQMIDVYAGNLAKEMQQQNFNPIVIQGAAYSPNLVSDTGPAGNGMYIEQSYPLYLPGQDSKNVPAASLFDHWMNEASSSPNFEIESIYGWISAELFVQALKDAGSPPTREGLLAALDKVTSFDAGGMIPTADPAANVPFTCWLLAQIKNGQIVRVPPSPKSGFVCSPGGLLASNGFKPEVRPSPSS